MPDCAVREGVSNISGMTTHILMRQCVTSTCHVPLRVGLLGFKLFITVVVCIEI